MGKALLTGGVWPGEPGRDGAQGCPRGSPRAFPFLDVGPSAGRQFPRGRRELPDPQCTRSPAGPAGSVARGWNPAVRPAAGRPPAGSSRFFSGVGC